MATPESVGERIDILLRERGMTQQQLAEAVGLSRGRLNARLRSSNFTEELIEQVAAALKTTPAYLRYGVRGTFEEGVLWAATQLRAAADRLVTEVGRGPLGTWVDEFGTPVPKPSRRRQASNE